MAAAGLLARLRRERELDALVEALPLVALGIGASGVAAEVENATLAAAGARAAAWGQGADLVAAWRERVGPGGAALVERWLPARNRPLPAEEAAWTRLADNWRAAIDAFQRSGADDRLPAFLRYARLAQPIDVQPTGDPARDADPGRAAAIDRVALLTAHAAKGKEWRMVCLLGAEDGEFPSRWAEDEDEERRVLYVAMSRAQQRLLVSWAGASDGRRRRLSRFLAGLPDGLLDRRP